MFTAATVAQLHTAFELPTVEGVTYDVTECTCDQLDCFFCGAVNDALWAAYAQDEMDEWFEKTHRVECCSESRRATIETHCYSCGACVATLQPHSEWCGTV